MSQPCLVLTAQLDLEQRLYELSLTPAILVDVVKHYATTVLSMTEDHPSWCTGISPAGEAVFALRQLTRPLGWTREEERGFALTVHPKGLLAVNVAKGDINTGNPEIQPTSHSEKGICTIEALAENQLSFDFPEEKIAQQEENEFRPTWYLLMRVCDGVVKSEFSLPIAMSSDKHISVWAERLILPDLKVGEIAGAISDKQTTETTDIKPVITKKNG